MELAKFVKEVYGVSQGCCGVEMEVEVEIPRSSSKDKEIINVQSATIRLFNDRTSGQEIGWRDN